MVEGNLWVVQKIIVSVIQLEMVCYVGVSPGVWEGESGVAFRQMEMGVVGWMCGNGLKDGVPSGS